MIFFMGGSKFLEMKSKCFLSLLLLAILACNSPNKPVLSRISHLHQQKDNQIWGHRFKITGDFDSDGQQETLTEFYYSHRNQTETNKYFQGIEDVWVLYDSAEVRKCQSFLLCSNPKLDTIPVSGILGPIWLKNEGDLDGDGGDEVSYVASYPQQSSVNFCHLLSYKKNQWKELYTFEIREWQIPPLPQAGKTYGLMGSDGFYETDTDDSLNQELVKAFNAFPGFITKLKNGKVEIYTFTEMADDTVVVLELKNMSHPKF